MQNCRSANCRSANCPGCPPTNCPAAKHARSQACNIAKIANMPGCPNADLQMQNCQVAKLRHFQADRMPTCEFSSANWHSYQAALRQAAGKPQIHRCRCSVGLVVQGGGLITELFFRAWVRIPLCAPGVTTAQGRGLALGQRQQGPGQALGPWPRSGPEPKQHHHESNPEQGCK